MGEIDDALAAMQADNEIPAPKKKNAWGASGALHTLSTVDEVSCQADFDVPDVYTIEFEVTPPAEQDWPVVVGIPQVRGVRATAEIIWNVQGFQIRRVIDVFNGATISGTGQGVTVKVTDASGPLLASPEVAYQVRYGITRGTRPQTPIPPIIWAGITGLIAPGGSVDVPVPQDSGVTGVYVQVPRTTPANTPLPEGIPVGVQILDAHTPGHLELGAYTPLDFQWVPLPAGAAIVRITSVQIAGNVQYTVYFSVNG